MTEQSIDPRDATEQDRHPSYRVEFWERDRPAVDTWRVTGRDIEGVLEWAHSEAAGRRVVVWVECPVEHGLALLRLTGDAGPGDYGSPSLGSSADAFASGSRAPGRPSQALRATAGGAPGAPPPARPGVDE